MSARSYKLLDGTSVPLKVLSKREKGFIRSLWVMASDGVDYFELYRIACGPRSPALQGRSRVDKELVQTPVYRIARDVVTRTGIRKGLILGSGKEPEVVSSLAQLLQPLSVPQAASLIGISRIAVYKAIQKGHLPVVKVGSVLIVERGDAEAYKRSRRIT
jgi:excisionase family DNA binding protein